jgi:hypothetical protein
MYAVIKRCAHSGLMLGRWLASSSIELLGVLHRALYVEPKPCSLIREHGLDDDAFPL